MKINRTLNLVIPVDTEKGTIYVHSTPITFDVFDRYAIVLARTFTEIYRKGLDVVAGPRVAARLLRQAAESEPGANGYANAWEGPEGVENGLLAEIRRLTNVIVPSEGGGWTTVPYHEVIVKNKLSREDVSDVENAIAFFTVAYWMHRGAQREATLTVATSLWGAELVSSTPMEYRALLQTSIEGASSGGTASI